MTHISLYPLVPAILLSTWFVLNDDHPAGIRPVAPNSRMFLIHNLESERRIRTKIASDAALKATLEMITEAARNEATFFRIVASEAVRHRAIDLTRSAHFGLKIYDRIAVQRAA
jgi:hypothetical protein